MEIIGVRYRYIECIGTLLGDKSPLGELELGK